MSILKYTLKYLLLGGLGLIVVVGIGTLVYNQLNKPKISRSRAPVINVSAQPPPPGESEKTGHWDGNVWKKIPVKVKKRTRQPSHIHDDHGHSHLRDPFVPAPRLPRDLKKRLEKVDSDGNSYYSNPNYFREVYEAVSYGKDMETTIKLLKAYNIYTDVVLEHMDSYEAFMYVRKLAPVDFTVPTIYDGNDIKYAKRVIAEGPSSPQALEAGLYLGYALEEPHEQQTAYLNVLEHHPTSAVALYGLGEILTYDQPELAIPYLKKAAQLDPELGSNMWLGAAYERLGDYKTAWLHYKKELNRDPMTHCLNNLRAIERGEPNLSPIVRDPVEASVPDSSEVRQDMPALTPADETDTFIDLPKDDADPVPPSVPDSPTPEDIARQEAERQKSERRALLDRMREQQEMEQEVYFKELEEFITWAESIMNDAPIDTNNFLAKELERHLLEQKTTFAPSRVTRGFELIQRYGQAEGMKRLERADPKLAKQVKQMLNEKNNRPKPNQR